MKALRYVKGGRAAMLAVLVLAGTCCCARPTPDPADKNYAGQTGPDYELDVAFRQGVSKRTANTVVTRCTADNPVVIRTVVLRLAGGELRQYTTKVIAKSTRSEQAKLLVSCFNNDKAVVSAGWPS